MTDAAPTTLAVERTHLAWRRTSLGLFGGGIAAAHLLQQYVGASAWSIAGIGLVAAVALAITSHRRHLVGRHVPPGGRLVTACALSLVVMGIAAVAFVLLHGA